MILVNKNNGDILKIDAWPAYTTYNGERSFTHIGWYSWEYPSDIYNDKGIWLPNYAWEEVVE